MCFAAVAVAPGLRGRIGKGKEGRGRGSECPAVCSLAPIFSSCCTKDMSRSFPDRAFSFGDLLCGASLGWAGREALTASR